MMSHANVVTHLYPGAKLASTERLTGGVSADVHRLNLNLAEGGRTSVVLRVLGESHPEGAAEFEYQLLQALHREGLPVPAPLMVDVTGRFLPDPFLVMAFVEGTNTIPAGQEGPHIDTMAALLAKIHSSPTSNLPPLPARINPLPEVFDYLPEGAAWEDLHAYLRSRTSTDYKEPPKLLHGDFWPANVLWQNGAIAAILDWEDAALGDPLSDVAVARVELRYLFGKAGMQRFTEAYARYHDVQSERLALWQVFVAAAAQRFVGEWGLEPAREAHIRKVALASIREAGRQLMGQSAR